MLVKYGGVRTDTVKKGYATLKEMTPDAIAKGENFYVFVAGHSRGTTEARLGMEQLSPEQRARIIYRGFGGSAQIDGDSLGLHSAHNFVAVGDLISRSLSKSDIDQLLRKDWASGKKSITFVHEGIQMPVSAHTFRGQQYSKYFEEALTSYKNG